MNNDELREQGERLHQQYLANLEAATAEQIEQANRAVEQHMGEYGHSFAHELNTILK